MFWRSLPNPIRRRQRGVARNFQFHYAPTRGIAFVDLNEIIAARL
jgi:hypothetical protein